jgi:signal transduction histidine kinase
VLNLDLAEKNGMTEDRLSALRNCALRIGSYVSSLLTLARVRAGKVRFAFEPLETRELVEEIADDLRPNGVRLAIEGAGTEINGDRTRLKEAVQNLILNASKHGEADEPVQVELSGTETEAVICVKSSGIGAGREIPVERYAVGSENGSSSGIGLSLAREIAERHSGKLLIDITESRTDVNVTIPRFKLKTNFAE